MPGAIKPILRALKEKVADGAAHQNNISWGNSPEGAMMVQKQGKQLLGTILHETHFPSQYLNETLFPFVSDYLFKYVFMVIIFGI